MLIVWHRWCIGFRQGTLPHGTIPLRALLFRLKARRNTSLPLIIMFSTFVIAFHAQFAHILFNLLYIVLIGEVLGLDEIFFIFIRLAARGQHFLLLCFDISLLASLGGEATVIRILYLLFGFNDAARAGTLLVGLVLHRLLGDVLVTTLIYKG